MTVAVVTVTVTEYMHMIYRALEACYDTSPGYPVCIVDDTRVLILVIMHSRGTLVDLEVSSEQSKTKQLWNQSVSVRAHEHAKRAGVAERAMAPSPHNTPYE